MCGFVFEDSVQPQEYLIFTKSLMNIRTKAKPSRDRRFFLFHGGGAFYFFEKMEFFPKNACFSKKYRQEYRQDQNR